MPNHNSQAQTIPTFKECEAVCESPAITPLQRFIYNYEPAGNEDEAAFRSDLQDLVNDLSSRSAKPKDALKLPDGFTRVEVVEFLRELLRIAVLHERAEDPGFKSWPDAEAIVNHIAIHGLPALLADTPEGEK